ncbi:MAG: nitrogen fixation protein NifQ [Candidatus Thiodiazotropha sp.]
MAQPMLANDDVQGLYGRLISSARQQTSTEVVLARLLSSWKCGYSVLPEWLGLGESEFHRMLKQHFPGMHPSEVIHHTAAPRSAYEGEMEDLRTLIMKHRSHRSEAEPWFAEILIAGCMGPDHLWQDLGLWSRDDLSLLISDHFHPLAVMNTKNMKWKKFLYKQLCETEGIYTCRSPSCEVCADYANCFGPEES